jgi:hypothetical protein
MPIAVIVAFALCLLAWWWHQDEFAAWVFSIPALLVGIFVEYVVGLF